MRLLRRRFDVADQKAFARLSGDANPVHMDAVEARRTITGAPVVHGMHMVLAALDALVAKRETSRLTSFAAMLDARFPKPVLVGDTLSVDVDDVAAQRCRLAGSVEGELVLDMTVELGPAAGRGASRPPSLRPIELRDLAFDDLAEQSGALDIGLDTKLASRMFPAAVRAIGPTTVAELVALSRLVGMECPGRHSLFGQLRLKFESKRDRKKLEYRVTRVDPRFLRAEIAVSAARLSGDLGVFFRPPPQAQAGMAEIAGLVRTGEFSASRALVVGGSRGLGEATAKIIAAGAGKPVITFHRGEADAQRVAAEIRGWGGSCEVARLDVLRPEAGVKRLVGARGAPRSLYYFATPKIFGRRRGLFGHELFRSFCDYYVGGFGTLLDAVAANVSGPKLSAFYPSSVAVQGELREMAEYAAAKRAGEEMCAFYNRYSDKVEIVVERLPRIRTDQTSTLMEVPAEDSVSVMLPIVRRVERVRS
jgi:acyl dehydratase